MKRLLSLFFAVIMSVVTLALSVTGYEGKTVKDTSSHRDADNCIYFAVPGGEDDWGHFDTIYCHIWIDGGDEFFTWQTEYEKCEKVKKNLWKYDLDNLEISRRVEGGFNEKTTYGVIFSDNIGNQTYDLYFTKECLGDTVECTNAYRGNPIDTSKRCIVARWQKNGDKYDSVEYTRSTVTVTVTNSDARNNEDNVKSLSQDMSMVIIFILSVVIILLVVFMVVKAIKNKRK